MNHRRKKIDAERSRRIPPRREWLFSKAAVPDQELPACVCWEYIREVRPTDLPPEGLSHYALGLLIDYRGHPQRRSFNDSFKKIPLQVLSFLTNRADLALPLPPWQALRKEQRLELSEPLRPAWPALIDVTVGHTNSVSWHLQLPEPVGPFEIRPWNEQERKMHAWAVAYRALYYSFEGPRGIPQSSVLNAGGSGPQSQVLREQDPRYWLAMSTAHGLIGPVPFLINWMEYEPAEIARAMEAWIKNNAPGFTPRGRAAGTTIDQLRGALRDLGALRILNVMTEPQFKRYDGDYDIFRERRKSRAREIPPELNMSRMKTRAVAFFRKFFAMATNQKPQSCRPSAKAV